MSIHDQILYCIRTGRLRRVGTSLGEPGVRRIFATQQVCRVLVGPWANETEAVRSARLHADLDSFIVGDDITVSMTPRRAGNAYMGVLAPVGDGMFDIRSRDPRPGLRVIGGFAGKDMFIAIRVFHRLALGAWGSDQWNYATNSCKADWRKLFHPYSPITGARIHDCISPDFTVV